jgi:hypothetical protein
MNRRERAEQEREINGDERLKEKKESWTEYSS